MPRATALTLAALVAVSSGCERGGASSTRITSDTLTVYAGLPLRGEREGDGRAVLRGMKLALDEAGGRVGRLDIGLIALDHTGGSTGRWDAHQVAINARIAAENPSTVAYVGDLDAGATAVALPLTNEIGILHVDPAGGATALSAPELYPSGRRTLAALGAPAAAEAAALARRVREDGARQVALVQDGALEGLGRGSQAERALRAAGLAVTEILRIDPEAPGSVARDVAAADADAAIFLGASDEAAVALLGAVHRRSPRLALYAASGVDPRRLARGLPRSATVRLTSAQRPGATATGAGREAAETYRARFGARAPLLALHGYAAMRGILEAIGRAGEQGNDRRAVLDAWRAGDAGAAVLGPAVVGDVVVRTRTVRRGSARR